MRAFCNFVQESATELADNIGQLLSVQATVKQESDDQ